MALFRGLPHVVMVPRLVLVVDSAPISHAQREIDVQLPGDGERVAVFGTHGMVHLVPDGSARLAAHVATTAHFEIVGEYLGVDADVMPRERFLLSSLAQPFAHGDVASVCTPVPVAAVCLPPAIQPVGSHRPAFAQVHFATYVRHQQCIVKHVRTQRHIMQLSGLTWLDENGFDVDGIGCDGCIYR